MPAEEAKKIAEQVFWLSVLIVVVVCGVSLVWWIRKRFRDNDGSTGDAGDFLLQMRDLQRSGDVTEEEYRSIKRRLAGRVDGGSETKPPESK